MKFPTNIGCTGRAIEKNKCFYFNKENKPGFFQSEIDNCVGVTKGVQSLLVAPIKDETGYLHGVV